MRVELQKLEGQRLLFKAKVKEFYKFNQYKDYYEWRVILEHVCRVDTDQEVANNLDFKVTKTIKEANLKKGDNIEFLATVGSCFEDFNYKQLGIDDRQLNYTLKRLGNLKKID